MKHALEIAYTAFRGSAAPDVPRANRVALGKALREKIPRKQHGLWKEVKGRPNPIHVLRASDAGRMKELVPIRYGRMLQSPFSFYRGAAGVMASDLAQLPHTDLKVQACGDCHLMNFGGFATPERNIIFDINDFDETLSAPWEWDVKRLTASIALAARSIGLPMTKPVIVPSVLRAVTGNTCGDSPEWTRFGSGTRTLPSTILLELYQRPCANAS